MRFSEWIGNEGLKARLSAQARDRGLSHAYLLAGPAGSGKHTLALTLAEAYLCVGEGEKPCGACSACRKVRQRIHPDVRWIDAPAVADVRALRKDAYIRPNEGARKVYIIENMHKVGGAAQNALLKVLEDGPQAVVFLLLADEEQRVFETVRSRCETLRLVPVEENAAIAYLSRRFPDASRDAVTQAVKDGGGYLGRAVRQLEAEQTDVAAEAQAASYLACLQKRDAMELLEQSVALEALPKEAWPGFLQALEKQLHRRLRETVEKNDRRGTAQALTYLKIVQTLHAHMEANVGLGHCAGLLHVLCAEAMERGEA